MNDMDNLKLIEELRNNFDKLLEINEKILNSLPDDVKVESESVRKDISDVTKAVRAGDLSALNALKEKYANFNNK
jgi:hypothetical protein